MDQLKENLENHLHKICLYPSRHVGSPGVTAAANYIERTFRRYGYTEVTREPFSSTGWRFGSMLFCDLDNGCADVPGAVPCFFSRSADVFDVPLWLSGPELNELEKQPLKGRLCIVEFFSDPADIRGRNDIAEDLDRMGAAAAIFISDPAYHTPCAASTKIQRSPHLKNLGTAAVAEEGAYYLARNRGHRFRFYMDADTFQHTSHNVVAVRSGTGSKRAVFGAHFDAAPLTQGAKDDASGTACLLEMARLLKNELPEWTFEFAAFDGEEYTLDYLPMGSGAYTAAHRDRKWEFYMNFDSIGTACSDTVLHIGRKEKLPDFSSIYPFRPIKKGGDDRSFDELGVPTLWFFSIPRFPDFHTPLDRINTLDISNIEQCIGDAVNITRQICSSH